MICKGVHKGALLIVKPFNHLWRDNHACTDMCIDMCRDMCLDVCIDMCRDAYISRRTDRCIGVCMGMCIDMCIDMCVGMLPCVKTWCRAMHLAPLEPSHRDGHLKYQHIYTHTTDMPSAMPM